jgi:tripartite-type tricarboxylate transporter receptor subunit TctC
LLCTPDAPITLSPLINKGLSYDPASFEPVISLAITYSAVAVRRDLPANSIAELIAYAEANPKRLNYATGGSGSSSHIAMLWFTHAVGIEMVSIPYPGSAPSVRALLAGEVDVLIDSVSVLLTSYRGGLVRVLAVGAPVRLAEMPEVPTLAEAGLGHAEFVNWYGIFAPKRTPMTVVARLNRAINDALALPDVRAAVDAMALRPVGGTPQDFREFIDRDRGRRGEAISGGVSPR